VPRNSRPPKTSLVELDAEMTPGDIADELRRLTFNSDEFSAIKIDLRSGIIWSPRSVRSMHHAELEAKGVADVLAATVGGPSVVKIILMITAVVMLWSSNATAQEETLRQRRVGHCAADLRRLCPGVQPGNNRLRACMKEHIDEVSFPCLVTLAKFAEVRRTLNQECSAHIRQQCAGVERGGGRLGACLRSAVASLSDTCKEALTRAVRSGTRTSNVRYGHY
jgi:hypothetical protein